MRSLLKVMRQQRLAVKASSAHSSFTLNLWQPSYKVKRNAWLSEIIYYQMRSALMKPPMRLPVEVLMRKSRFYLYQRSQRSPTDQMLRSVVPLRKSRWRSRVDGERAGSSQRRNQTRQVYQCSPILKIGWKRGMLLLALALLGCWSCSEASLAFSAASCSFCAFLSCRYWLMSPAGRQWLSANSSSSSISIFSPFSSINTLSSSFTSIFSPLPSSSLKYSMFSSRLSISLSFFSYPLLSSLTLSNKSYSSFSRW